MSLKSTLEDNVVIFFVGTLITGFVTGWGAHIGVQSASGLVLVSSEKAKLVEGDMPDRLLKAEGEVSRLTEQLRKNLPTGKTYISNVILSPESPGELLAEHNIVVNFDYVVAPGTRVRIYTEHMDATANATYEPSPFVEGSGHASRSFTLNSPGQVRSFAISMQAPNGEELYVMRIPVNYTFK